MLLDLNKCFVGAEADDVFLEKRASDHKAFAFDLRVHRTNLYWVCVLSQC